MRITVSGLPGSGTTTVSKLLAEYYELELISSGEIFRRIAREKGMSLAEFGAMAEKDPSIDLAIDKNQRAVIQSHERSCFSRSVCHFRCYSCVFLFVCAQIP